MAIGKKTALLATFEPVIFDLPVHPSLLAYHHLLIISGLLSLAYYPWLIVVAVAPQPSLNKTGDVCKT